MVASVPPTGVAGGDAGGAGGPAQLIEQRLSMAKRDNVSVSTIRAYLGFMVWLLIMVVPL